MEELKGVLKGKLECWRRTVGIVTGMKWQVINERSRYEGEAGCQDGVGGDR